MFRYYLQLTFLYKTCSSTQVPILKIFSIILRGKKKKKIKPLIWRPCGTSWKECIVIKISLKWTQLPTTCSCCNSEFNRVNPFLYQRNIRNNKPTKYLPKNCLYLPTGKFVGDYLLPAVQSNSQAHVISSMCLWLAILTSTCHQS